MGKLQDKALYSAISSPPPVTTPDATPEAKAAYEATYQTWYAKHGEKDEKALGKIGSSISNRYARLTSQCDSAKSLWDALKSICVSGSTLNNALVRNKLNNYRATSDDILDYLGQMETMKFSLTGTKSEPSDEDFCLAILNGLPSSWSVTTEILRCQPTIMTSYTALKAAIIAANEAKGLKTEQKGAYQAAFKGKCNACHKPGHKASDCRNNVTCEKCQNKGHTKEKCKTDMKKKCSHCDKYGHIANECRQRQRQNDSEKHTRQNDNSSDKHKPTDKSIFMAKNKKENIEKNKKENIEKITKIEKQTYSSSLDKETKIKMYIDSGCTNHMVHDIKLLHDIKYISPEPIELADKSVIYTTALGKMRTTQGSLNDVYYVPDIGSNLFSLKQVDKLGASVVFKDNEVHFTNKQGEHVLTGTLSKLYEVELTVIRNHHACYKTEKLKQNRTHLVMGHPSYAVTKLLETIQEISPSENAFCEICCRAKSTIKPYSHKDKRVHLQAALTLKETKELTRGLISLDIAGPIEESGKHDDEKYMLIIVDHGTDMSFSYPMKYKGEQMQLIKDHIIMSNNQGHLVTEIKCDNSRENTSKELLEFYKAKGIIFNSNIHGVKLSNETAVLTAYGQ